MTAELGVCFLVLAFLVSLLQAGYLWAGAPRLLVGHSLPMASWLQALFITLAFATLITLRLDSDFSVVNVIEHSNLSLPTIYKISGSWGNHEGSMLLWVWVLAMYGALLMPAQGAQHAALKRLAVAIQSLVCAGFLLFILCTSNPFARRFPPVVDGEALNPLLQDIGLAIHPPLLYLGYVGFSIVFSLSVAALLQGHAGRDWARAVHPWILASWSALTIGIGLGSWWAYRELGWGGWWFWDPVENASLLPWLSGTALLHSNLVLKKRGVLQSWVLLLAIITFGLSLLGTFLVRSGALTSVHSFASDPTRGFFILGYIVITIGGGLLLFGLRAGKLRDCLPERMLPASREGMIVINNLFLLTACATVLLGTLYPMLTEALNGEKLSVGPPYFNRTFLPLMAVALIFTGFTPFMPWKKASLSRAFKAAQAPLLAALGAAVLLFALVNSEKLLAAGGIGLSTWLAAASLQWLYKQRGRNAAWPVFLAHLGAAVLVAGITCSSLWKEETERWLAPGDSIAIADYHITLQKLSHIEAPNYHGMRAELLLRDASGREALLSPEYHIYAIRGTGLSQAAIYSPWLSDLYAVIGESSADETKLAVRVYYHPMIRLIWIGCMLMALGGMQAIIITYLGRRRNP